MLGERLKLDAHCLELIDAGVVFVLSQGESTIALDVIIAGVRRVIANDRDRLPQSVKHIAVAVEKRLGRGTVHVD